MDYIPLKMYCIFDKITKKFDKPFCAENDDAGIRAFEMSFKNYPQVDRNDYSLYRVGEFNDYSASLTPCAVEEVLGIEV